MESTHFHNAINSHESQRKKNHSEIPKWWQTFRKRRLTYKDQLSKNWIQKWIYHGRFPFKFVFHFLLTVACTWLIFLVGNKQGGYAVSSTATWCEILLKDYCNTRDYTPDNFYLTSIQDSKQLILDALERYEKVPTTFIGKVDQHHPIKLIVRSYSRCDDMYDPNIKNVDTSTIQETYHVNSTQMGPLNDGTNLVRFFQCLSSMTLQFELQHIHLSTDDRPIIFLWWLKVILINEENTGRLTGSFETFRWPKFNDSTIHYVLQTRIVLDIAIIIIAFVSQVLHWISIVKSIRIFTAVKRKVYRKGAAPQTWNTLPFATKLKFFNLWFIIAIVGSFCNMLGSFLDIFFSWEQDSVSSFIKITIGLGAALAWIYILSYLEFNKKYTVLIDALILGMPNVLRFTVGAIPVYVGFALFGFAAFSESTLRFGSFGQAVVTLFGIQNGDDMQATFRALDSQVWVSRIYFFIFSIISIYTIANIFIAIMSNAYNYSAKKIHQGDDLVAHDEQQTKMWADIMNIGSDSDDDDDDASDDGASKRRRGKKMKSSTGTSVAESHVHAHTASAGSNSSITSSSAVTLTTTVDANVSTNNVIVPDEDASVKTVATELVMKESMMEINGVVREAQQKIRGILRNTNDTLHQIENDNDSSMGSPLDPNDIVIVPRLSVNTTADDVVEEQENDSNRDDEDDNDDDDDDDDENKPLI